MKGYRRPRRLIQLAQLLTIASTASAVSLQDFQTITIIQVPSLSCLGAYGSRIQGCSRSDFKDGVQCSESCAKGIQQDQANIITACRNLEVNDRSLLGLALQGGLLDALCPDFQATSVTSTAKQTTTRTFLTPSQTQETSTSTTSTIESSSTITTSISESSESSTTAQSTPSETDTTTVVSATPTETEGTTTILSTTTSSTSTPSPTQTSDNGDSQPDRGSSGGGSPFDTVFIADLQDARDRRERADGHLGHEALLQTPVQGERGPGEVADDGLAPGVGPLALLALDDDDREVRSSEHAEPVVWASSSEEDHDVEIENAPIASIEEDDNNEFFDARLPPPPPYRLETAIKASDVPQDELLMWLTQWVDQRHPSGRNS
ncbi:hypothetical protein CHU98_g6397 [Xylaria longipes]|nr:hypothetical protein CHU98_g6397 [Xylaria longipes]